MNRKAVLVCLMMVLIGVAFEIHAQDADDSAGMELQLLPDPQLDQITGPIALYPDPLIAQILPAATQPEQIAMAYNYVMQGGDPNAIDSQPWDESVKAVAHYPDVLKLMDGDLSWTTQLGDAFVDQPSDVMNSIQRLRAQAVDLGNLQSTPQEEVDNDDGDIEIVPADPDMIYVPVYDPGIVFYQRPYGRAFITFGAGFGIGLWLNHDFDWHDHHVVVWGHDHPRPANFWHERPVARRQAFAHVNAWHPPANHIEHRPVVANRGFDRGYEPRTVHVAPAHESRSPVEVHTIPSRPTVKENIAPHVNPAPHVAVAPHVEANVNVHVATPGFGVFTGAHTAVETHAASTRGIESRAVTPHPSISPAPHPSGGGGGGAPHPSGGGGGGGRPSGGGGGGKR